MSFFCILKEENGDTYTKGYSTVALYNVADSHKTSDDLQLPNHLHLPRKTQPARNSRKSMDASPEVKVGAAAPVPRDEYN